MPLPEDLLKEAMDALHARTKQQEEEAEKVASKTISLPHLTLDVSQITTITATDMAAVAIAAPGLTADDLPTAESVGHSSNRINAHWGYYCSSEDEYQGWPDLNVFQAWMCSETNIDADNCGCGEWWTNEEPTERKVGLCTCCDFLFHSNNVPDRVVLWECASCETWFGNCCEANDCCPDDD